MDIQFKFGQQPSDTQVHFKLSHNQTQHKKDKITMQKLQWLANYKHSTIPQVTWQHVYNELFKK